MRFSLIGREIANDSIDAHLNANDVKGLIAVVACDKPPVGTLAAVLEHNEPAVFLSDGSIKPGHRSRDRRAHRPGHRRSRSPATPTPPRRTHMALHACPGQGSCGGMFTYNTMQTFIAVLGMEPLHMVAPPSDDPRRLEEFPEQLVDCLVAMTQKGIRPRDIVTPRVAAERAHRRDRDGRIDERRAPQRRDRARRRASTSGRTSSASASSTSCRSACRCSINARPFGLYSMVDIDAKGGLQVIVKELLDAGFARRRLRHVHRRDARRAGAPPRSAGAGRRGHPLRRAAVQEDGRPPPAVAATSRPRAARSSRSPASRAASRTASSPDGLASSTARRRSSPRSRRRRTSSRTTTWS